MLDEIGYDEFVGGWFEYARNVRIEDRLRQVLLKLLIIRGEKVIGVFVLSELLKGEGDGLCNYSCLEILH